MAAKRLTRKEIQHDVIGERLASTSGWVVRHGRTLLIGLAGIAVAFLVGYLWTTLQAQRNAQVQAQFGAALTTFHGSVAPVAGEDPAGTIDAPAVPLPTATFDFQTDAQRAQAALEKFTNLADTYTGTHLGDLSNYYVALAQRDLGQRPKARETLAAITNSSQFSDVRNLARNALAQVLSSSSDHQGSIEQLKAILAEAPADFPVRLTLVALAREYESAGETSLAVETYRQILTEYPTSGDARTAQSKVDQLEPTLPAAATTEVPAPETGF